MKKDGVFQDTLEELLLSHNLKNSATKMPIISKTEGSDTCSTPMRIVSIPPSRWRHFTQNTARYKKDRIIIPDFGVSSTKRRIKRDPPC